MKNVMKIVGGVILALLVVAIFAGGSKETEQTSEVSSGDLDSLRKCAVMEAADIYTTGVGKKSDNVFNDGREVCEEARGQLSQADFDELIEIDWLERRNDEIEGKPLEHYLTILGW